MSADELRQLRESLKGELVAELRQEFANREKLKRELLADLRGGEKERSKLTEQALLLFLTFLLTGVLGTWLTNFWQNRAQAKQQQEQARTRSLQQKYEIADQINKAVAEVYTGANVFLGILSYRQNPERFESELAERLSYWRQANRNWIVTSLVLQQKLAVNFKSSEAAALYQEIMDKEESLVITFNRMLPAVEQSKGAASGDPEIEKSVDTVFRLVNDMRDSTGVLMQIMVREIREEERR